MAKKIWLTGLFTLSVYLSHATAQERICTEKQMQLAEGSGIGSARGNWTSIYGAFKRLGHCNDGFPGEVWSETIVSTLADRCGRRIKLFQFMSSDVKFRAFVLSHIDATTDGGDLRKILLNARTRCPLSAKTLCSSIGSRARSALRDMNKIK